MTNPALSNAQIRHLKSLGHHLKPVVRVGQNGFTDAVASELEIALSHHELVKVKIAAADREDRSRLLDTMASRSQSVIVQALGGTALLFRRNPRDPVITF